MSDCKWPECGCAGVTPKWCTPKLANDLRARSADTFNEVMLGREAAALQQIADMDPQGLRADDLGRAARIARSALGVAPSDDTKRLDWLLPNLHPANFGLDFQGGYEWADDAEFLSKWRAAIDEAMGKTSDGVQGTHKENGNG